MNVIGAGRVARLTPSLRLWKRIGWWTFFSICAFYGGFALFMGSTELLYRLGVVESAPLRGLPFVFVVHALTGGIVLLCAPLQFNRDLLRRHRLIHRVLGRVYVASVWVASGAGLWLTVTFDVSFAAKLALGAVSILWFGTTTCALLYVLRRRLTKHREWMIRSLALTCFFITFSLWVPGLARSSIPEAVGYPLAIFLSWSLNLVVAEIWIRYTRMGVDL